MATMATINHGKKLNQPHVTELQAQQENRGLDETGVKSTLVDRLQKYLLDSSLLCSLRQRV